MERAGRVLSKLKLSSLSDEQVACAAWAQSVGKKIATHTRPLLLVRNRLVIEVEDAVWQRQLFGLRHQIIDKLTHASGRSIVAELEFRIGVPRRAPQRAESIVRPADEADAIVDPILRSLYKTARKKATA